MYITEMHCHSNTVSLCSNASPAHIVEKFLAAGYTTLVSTDHINKGTYWGDRNNWSWEEKVDFFTNSWSELEKASAGRLHILYGAEICLFQDGNDYLVYGLTKEKLLALGDPRVMKDIGVLSDALHALDCLIFQAHPFRIAMTITYPQCLDGYEIANLNPWANSHNEFAAAWAKHHNLPGISGTDFHAVDHNPRGGIQTEYPITDNETLLRTLREQTYTPILG